MTHCQLSTLRDHINPSSIILRPPKRRIIMSFEALQDRLTALQETTTQLQDLISRLSNLKFQPGSVPLSNHSSDDEPNVATELSGEISQILREEEEDLELLVEEISDLRTGKPGSEAEHAKARLRDGASRLETELKRCRVSFRKAQLEARRSLESAQRLERELLLAGYSRVASESNSAVQSGRNSPSGEGEDGKQRYKELFPAGYRPGKKAKKGGNGDEKDNLVSASSSVTEALRRTHALVQNELSRSEYAKQTLAESTAALESLQHNYTGLDDLLQSSRDLLGTLLTSNKSDTWYLETAVWMLLTTLGWLVFRRWIYGPAWWLVWLPLRTFWGVGKGAVGLVGGGAGKGVEVGVQEGGVGKVTGLNEQGRVPVPTVRTGREEEVLVSDPDSMVEKVGRMVEEIETQLGNRQEGALDDGDEEYFDAEGKVEVNETDGDVNDLPNPKKRMWEEDTEVNPQKRIWEEDREVGEHAEAERARDEL